MDKTLVDYFIDQTDKKFKEVSGRFDKVDERFDRQDGKLDALFAFKWQIVGMSAGAGAILSVMVAVAIELIKAH